MKRKDGGPAFPLPLGDESISPAVAGMTLRDYFAAKVLEGFMANKNRPCKFEPRDDAKYCYAVADAMLAERDAS